MSIYARIIAMGVFLIVVGGIMQMAVMVIPGVVLLIFGALGALGRKGPNS